MVYNIDSRISRHYLEMTAQATRDLLAKGFTPSGTSGDVSMRDPQTGLIYITGHMWTIPFPYNDLGCYRAQDIVVYEPDGTKLTPWSVSTVETPMHLAIYRSRPDVHAIVHSHPKWASVFAINREKIPMALAEQMGNLGGEVNIADYAPAGELAMGKYVAEALGNKNAVIMANHGAVTVGTTFEMAYRYSYFLEQISQKIIFAKLMGTVHTLSPDELTPSKLMEGTYDPKTLEALAE